MTPSSPTAPAAAPPPAAPLVELLAVARIAPSLSNPRKVFEPKSLEELGASIVAHGLAEPLLVRPIPPGGYRAARGVTVRGERERQAWALVRGPLAGGEAVRVGLDKGEAEALAARFAGCTHELVCGERRWRAARAQRVEALPALVRELSDQAVLEIQLIENLQREGLDPLDEAEGFNQLVHQHNLSVEDIVAKTGKSRRYVYGRMALRSLCDEARKALAEGILTASTAGLVARLPHKELQLRALKEFRERMRYQTDGDPVSFRAAAELMREDFMLDLKGAPFDVKAPGLPGGPCAACPKRTGNQRELFNDVTGADICTDPSCFKAKTQAWAMIKLHQAEEKGAEVIPEKKAKEMFWDSGQLRHGDPVDLDAECHDVGDGRKTWRQVLAQAKPAEPLPTQVAVDPRGQVRELVTVAGARAALKAAGLLKKTSPGSDDNDRYAAQQRAKEKARKRRVAAMTTVAEEARAAILAKATLGGQWLGLVFLQVFAYGERSQYWGMAVRRGLVKAEGKPSYSEQYGAARKLEKWAGEKQRTSAELETAILEAVLCAGAFGEGDSWSSPHWDTVFISAAKLAGINVAAREKAVLGAQKAAAKKAGKAKPVEKKKASGRPKHSAAARAKAKAS